MTNVLTEVTLEQNGEMAVVKLVEGERVAVERGGKVTLFNPEHTVETVVTEFERRGWEKRLDDIIPQHIQKDVDEYLELHEQMSQLKKQMDKLKKNVRFFMESNGIEAIEGTKGKQVYLQEAKASNATSRYTDYELKDIQMVLEGSLLRKVTEIRVNADKLDGLLKVEKLPPETVEKIKSLKIVKEGTPRFAVKK